MKKQGMFSVGTLSLSIFLSFFTLKANAQSQNGNAILLMLDGVRWQEVFYGADPEISKNVTGEAFPNLWKELMHTGMIFGDVKKSSEMLVANPVNISLPAYQSIMTGKTQPCWTNECSRVNVETIQERVLRELKLDHKQVATIASWKQIALAAEHVEGSTFVNASINILDDGDADPEIAQINKQQAADTPPWERARFDKYTFAQALHYLKKHQPRFMFISLNDSDEWGHRGDYKNYIETLRQYDAWMKQLSDTLGQMGEYGKNTTLMVTTDHGRGDKGNWPNHGSLWPESKYIWLYAKSAGTARAQLLGGSGYNHLDIRPTLEAAVGLKPDTCSNCGKVIRQIVPN